MVLGVCGELPMCKITRAGAVGWRWVGGGGVVWGGVAWCGVGWLDELPMLNIDGVKGVW